MVKNEWRHAKKVKNNPTKHAINAYTHINIPSKVLYYTVSNDTSLLIFIKYNNRALKE